MVLTTRDIDVLAALADWGFLGSSVIGAWFWGGDSSALRTRLKKLHDAGWVDKFRPKAATGSREWCYQLTDQGLRVVAEEGRLAPEADRHARVLTSAEYAAHDLQIAALVTLIADRAAKLIDPNGRGPLPERAPFRWQGAAWGRVDPTEDPMADGHPKGVFDVDLFAQDPGSSWEGVLEPDATLLGFSHDEREPDAVLIEYDRTRRPSKQKEKLHRYDRFLSSTWRYCRYAAHPHEPAVIWICAAEAQLKSFVKAADPELTAFFCRRPASMSYGLDPYYDNATYPGREQIAWTSRERIQAGNWEMLQVPPEPPKLRQQFNGQARYEHRTIQLDLTQLFAPTR